MKRCVSLVPILAALAVALAGACSVTDVENPEDRDALLEQQLVCQADVGDPCAVAGELEEWALAWENGDDEEAAAARSEYWSAISGCETATAEFVDCIQDVDEFTFRWGAFPKPAVPSAAPTDAPTGETSTTCYTGNDKCKLTDCTGSCAGQTDTYVKCTSPGGGTPSKQCTSAGANCVGHDDCVKNGNAGPAE